MSPLSLPLSLSTDALAEGIIVVPILVAIV